MFDLRTIPIFPPTEAAGATDHQRSSNSKPVRRTSQRVVDFPIMAQTHPWINIPGDQYEWEAERVARQVVSEIHTPLPDPENSAQKFMSKPEEKTQAPPGSARKRETGNDLMAVPATLKSLIRPEHERSQPLADELRVPMEQAFGANFDQVRIHTNSHAHRINHFIGARAFTLGNDIFFRQGEYHPEESTGQRLLAHELTHVVQQRNSNALDEAPGMNQPKVHLKAASMLQRSEFRIKDKVLDTVNYLPSKMKKAISDLADEKDLTSLKSLRAALEEDQKNPPEITGLDPDEVTELLTMTNDIIRDLSTQGKASEEEGEGGLPSEGKGKNEAPSGNIYGPTPDKEPQGLLILYRSMSANGLERIIKSLQQGKGPGLGNKRHKETKQPVGENFYASSLDYAKQYVTKGKRNAKGTVTLRFALDPDVVLQLLHNPKFARTHESTHGLPDTQGIKKARKEERGTVLIKDERLKKKSIKTSRNYGLRETVDPSSADNPYTFFNKHIVSINIV